MMRQKMMKGEQEQVKLVHWKTPSKEINFEEELFPRRDPQQKLSPVVSRLAQQLEGIGLEGRTSPWQEYGM